MFGLSFCFPFVPAMLDVLPLELACQIVQLTYKEDKFCFADMFVVSKGWHERLSHPSVWYSLCLEYHPLFLASFNDAIHVQDMLHSWNIKEGEGEDNESQQIESKVNWVSKFIEWELLDEINILGPIAFYEHYEDRLAMSEALSCIAKSKFVSLHSLLELIAGVHSGLKVAAGICLTSVFELIAEIMPECYLAREEAQIEDIDAPDPTSRLPDLSPTVMRRMELARKTKGLHPSWEALLEEFVDIQTIMKKKKVWPNMDHSLLMEALIENIGILLEDRASRVSFRAMQCIGALRPIALLFAEKIRTDMLSHYNEAIVYEADIILKALKKPSLATKIRSKFLKP